jgi:hypothetical protein
VRSVDWNGSIASSHSAQRSRGRRTIAALVRVSNGKSFFAHLLDALHESRRLQAERVIHHYRHLLQRRGESETR